MPMFGALEVGVESAGVLIAPTGRIAAGDPHLCLNSSPDFALRFTAEVPAGRYPLELCTVAVEDASGAVIDHRNAAARLRVSDAPVALWEMGVAEGMDLARLGDDQFFGYPVDTACGSFMDVALLGSGAIDSVARVLGEELEKREWQGAAEAFDNESKANIIAFTSGPGDGLYPTYGGLMID